MCALNLRGASQGFLAGNSEYDVLARPGPQLLQHAHLYYLGVVVTSYYRGTCTSSNIVVTKYHSVVRKHAKNPK